MMAGSMLFVVLSTVESATYLDRYIPGETLVIQFGQPRTATTLQHRIAMEMARRKNHEFEKEDVVTFNTFVDGVPFSLAPNRVLKTHLKAEDLYEYLDQVDVKVLLFTTTEDEESKVHDLEKAMIDGISRVAYFQLFDVVKYSPLLVIHDYAEIFNLTQDHLALGAVPISCRTFYPSLDFILLILVETTTKNFGFFFSFSGFRIFGFFCFSFNFFQNN